MKKICMNLCYQYVNAGNKCKKMKLLVVFYFIGLMAVSANTYSQKTKFTFLLENVTVKEVFTHIEKNSEFILFYNEDYVDINRKVSIDVTDEIVVNILNETFIGTNNSFKIYDRQIVISSKEETNSKIPERIIILQPQKPESFRGSIKGHVTDEDGLPMVGATIIIDQTTTGTITDANGNYQLLGVSSGKHKIRISFIGYLEELRDIEIIKGGVVNLDVKMKGSSIELLDIVAYGQARGQRAAINQQINAAGIVNVVSSEKLQELPDVNVAEAIGRLPGLMVQRNRGEGQKIIIRGLAPKYNTVSINGNMAPSTSPDDRSTDLNMISPDILGGVEVIKAVTAENDAAGLGGTVNLILKEAPSGLKINARILTGYSGFSKSISTFKGNFYISNRFFNDKLGIMLTGNAETAERNSDQMNVSYSVQGNPNYEEGETYIKPWIGSLKLQANIENRTRAGGSALFDWKLSPSSTIKSSNFIGYLNRNIHDREKRYDPASSYLSFNQYNNEINQLLLSNSIEGRHFILGSVLDWGGSRSQSINNKPYGHKVEFRKTSSFNNYAQGASFDIEPPELLPSPENVNDFIDEYYFYASRFPTYEAKELEYSLFLNFKSPFKIGEFISGYVKAGTKYRQKDRSRINEMYSKRIDDPSDIELFKEVFPEYSLLTTQGVVGKLSILNFLDENYKATDFLNNKYEYLKVDEVLDRNIINNVNDGFLNDFRELNPSVAQNDYKNHESILAFYLMSEIKLGEYITFIPGIRYEKTDIEYLGYTAEAIPEDLDFTPDEIFSDSTATNSYGYFLPQIHLKIKPFNWFDIRLAYTNTLSRPSYAQLAPKKIIDSNKGSVSLGNTELKPVLSENYDAILTFYKQKYGLFSFGVFYKDIKDFLWNRSALIVKNTETDPILLNLPDYTIGFNVNYPQNNSNRSSIKGFEFDIQSNMNFLPVKGFVCNINFTLMESETKYSETLLVRTLNPDYGVVPGAPRTIFLNQDTAYVDRLLSQPTYLFNAGLGYDNNKIGLSVRLSFNYQDNILTKEQRRPDGADREGTREFYRWDFQFNQRITKRLTLNGNIANIFNQPDSSERLITGYIKTLEYYGYMAQLGVKFDLY